MGLIAKFKVYAMRFSDKTITFGFLMSTFLFVSGCGGPSGGMIGDTGVTELERLKPIVEKKETISATGYAVIDIQRHDNAAQRRLLAIRASKLDAYRDLVEQVYGQYLDSNTTVADMVVKSDTFRSKVEGVIYGARLVSITPVGEDTYEVTLTLDKQTVRDLRMLYLEHASAAGV